MNNAPDFLPDLGTKSLLDDVVLTAMTDPTSRYAAVMMEGWNYLLEPYSAQHKVLICRSAVALIAALECRILGLALELLNQRSD